MPGDAYELKEDYPDFYGHLLKANRSIDDSGTSLVIPLMLMAIGLCVAIHMKWLDRLFETDLESIRGWGTYLAICGGCFGFFAMAINMLERRAYSAAREEIVSLLQETRWTVNELIAAVADDEKLKKLAEYLERDKYL
jgi:hypothetical protein